MFVLIAGIFARGYGVLGGLQYYKRSSGPFNLVYICEYGFGEKRQRFQTFRKLCIIDLLEIISASIACTLDIPEYRLLDSERINPEVYRMAANS